MSVEDVNSRILMTADFDVNTEDAEVEIKPMAMPVPNESTNMDIIVRNMALSNLDDVVLELYQINGGISEKIFDQELKLRGGEELLLPMSWQAPDDPADTKLKAVIKDGGENLCSDEQDIIAKADIDIPEAGIVFEGRNRMLITGTAVNNGDIAAA
ncbi:MAG TPA: hypothetical protein VEG39_16745 [Clostridia bacterium]|nr:hypothetical protein [Clostridia bacterium]